jgi:Ca2+-transporting ATPase
MRVLAVARRDEALATPGQRADDEQGLTLLGLLGFRDPLRPAIPAAVAVCRGAGVRVKLVTGDHPETARAIAAEAGLETDGGVVTGAELEAMSPAERRQTVASRSVFARVSPRGKHLIVEALRDAGEVVAMTGDGINDAPALRRAHIGVSMGRRASAVARAAADMVLLEDDLGALVAAIREGRALFRDIQRVFLYLIAFHVPIVALALASPVLGLPLVLLPVHLVWLELIVHPVSALAFRGDDSEDDRLMTLPPRSPSAPLLARPALVASLLTGATLAAVVLALFLFALPRGESVARSLALVGLLCGYQGLVLVERASLRQPGEAWLPRSRRFWLTWVASAVGSWLVFQIPALAALLRVSGPPPSDLLLAAGAGLGAVLWRCLRR